MPGARGAQEPGHAEQALGPEDFGIEEVVVEAPVDDVDPGAPGGRFHIDPVVLVDEEVAALDQWHAHFARQEHVLEVGRVVDARREQDDLGVVDRGRRDLGHGLGQARSVVVHGLERHARAQVREGAQHEAPVLDHVGDPRGAAPVVLEHQELAGLVAHDVGAADVDVGAVGHVEAGHLGAVVGGVQHQLGGHDAVVQDLLAVVKVVQEQVERGNALDDAALDGPPVRGREHARDHVEGQDPVDGGGAGIEREGDAQVEQLAPGVACAAPELVHPQTGQVAPEAAVGGPIALVRDGDVISLDIPKRRIDVQVSDDEMKRRRDGWKAPATKYTSGALAKYARLVSSASEGAVCG